MTDFNAIGIQIYAESTAPYALQKVLNAPAHQTAVGNDGDDNSIYVYLCENADRFTATDYPWGRVEPITLGEGDIYDRARILPEKVFKDWLTLAPKRLGSTCMADVKPRRVDWLWQDRIAVGTLSLIAGREGLGKSTIAYTLAAQVTTGTMPGVHYGTPRDVLVCATEDSWEYTIVPRLIAAGADREHVYALPPFTLPEDVEALTGEVEAHDTALVILDPILSRLSSGLDTHKDSEVRQALEPLTAMADRTGITVMGIIHHNKSTGSNPGDKVMGSRAFTAVARSVFHVTLDPDDETDRRRLFGPDKNNLGPIAKTQAFHIESFPINEEIVTGRVVWDGEVDTTIRRAMEAASQVKTQVGDAEAWLRAYLTEQGGSSSVSDVQEASSQSGISWATFQRARSRMADITVEADPDNHRKRVWVLAS